MAFPQKTSTPIAVKDRSTQDLSCQHVTTADFMTFNVAKALELVPQQSVDVQMQTFARLEPLPVPTFGRANIHNRAYFVPFRTVWTAWDDFANDTPHIYDSGVVSQVTSVPLLSTSDISNIFSDDDFSIEVAGDQAYDFEYVQYSSSGTIQGTPWKGKFTPLGRQTYKLLRSLGYSVDFNNNRNFVSALPLLCLCRVYNDYFYPSAYANDDDSAWLQSFFKNNNDLLTDDTIFMEDGLRRIFKIITKVSYSSDYFTSAWDNPNAPNTGLASSIVINDIDSNTEGADYENVISYDYELGKASPYITNPSNGSLNNISQFALNALRSLTDYMKRHQIAGSRVIDRYLSRWGIKLKSEQLNRSMYLGEWKQDIKFGDVLSTSDTDGAQLGAFAGRGISFGDGNVHFSCEEHGMMIITSTIVPVTQYYQGEIRHCNHLTKLDFFTPEFDNLGTQAIACNELYSPIGRTLPGYREKIFGFSPRYAEYKVPVSQITGDYVCNSINVGKDSWTLFRDVSSFVESEGLENLEHSMSFVEGNDRDQYNRIFYNTSSSADHFNIIHDFNIKSSFPGKSLFDIYEFENEDKSKKVSLDVNGSTHN